MAMWRDKNSQSTSSAGSPPASSPSTTPSPEHSWSSTPRPSTPPVAGSQPTCLGRTVVLHGVLSGNEDLTIEGKFDGEIVLEDHCLTVSQDADVKAEIRARHVVVMGSVTGNVTGSEKVEIRRTGRVLGDLRTAGVAIEDGAYFKGSVEIVREDSYKQPVMAMAAVAAASSGNNNE